MEIFKKLVKWADVVAEGFPAGVMDKQGLDYEGLKKVNPEISCSAPAAMAIAARWRTSRASGAF